MPPFGAITILGAMSRRISSIAALSGLIAGFTIAVALLIIDKLGLLANVAEQTLYLRSMVTFSVTITIAYLLSFIYPCQKDKRPDFMGNTILYVTPKIIRTLVILITLIVIMYLFWTIIFS